MSDQKPPKAPAKPRKASTKPRAVATSPEAFVEVVVSSTTLQEAAERLGTSTNAVSSRIKSLSKQGVALPTLQSAVSTRLTVDRVAALNARIEALRGSSAAGEAVSDDEGAEQ